MKKKLLIFMFVLLVFSVLPTIKINAATTRTYDTLTKESTIYVGEIFVDRVEKMQYVYSSDIKNVEPANYSISVFEKVEEFLPLRFAALIPDNEEIDKEGMAYSTLYADEMDDSWKDASNVASKYFINGTYTNIINENLYDVDANFKEDIDKEDAQRKTREGTILSADKRILAALNYKQEVSSDVYTYYYDLDGITVIYTSVNVQTTPRPNYTLTYYTYDGTNSLRVLSRETVEQGTVINEPSEVPTLQGYFFDKWRDENGAEVTFPITVEYNTRLYASWFKDIVDIQFLMKNSKTENVSAETNMEEYINAKKEEFETQMHYFATKYNVVNMPDDSYLFSTGGTAYRYAIYNGYNLRSIVSTDQIDPFTKSKTDEADALFTLVTVTKEGEGPLYIKGDMNSDKFVNSTDASFVLDRYKNDDATFDDYDRGDMNSDGILNAIDAAMILDIFKNS